MRLLYIFIIFNIFIFSENLFSKELSEREKFDNLSKEISNWGRWGANDQLGTLNNISNSNIWEHNKCDMARRNVEMTRRSADVCLGFRVDTQKHKAQQTNNKHYWNINHSLTFQARRTSTRYNKEILNN